MGRQVSSLGMCVCVCAAGVGWWGVGVFVSCVCERDCNYFLNDTKIHTLLDFCFFGFGILDFAYNFDADTVNDFADRRLAVCISQHLATTATRNANLIIIRDRGFLAPFASSSFRVASLSDSNI